MRQLAPSERDTADELAIDVDDLKRRLGVRCARIEGQPAERTFVCIDEQCFSVRLVGMGVGQSGAFEFVQGVSVPAVDPAGVGTVSVGRKQEDTLNAVV